jgi:DNA-binding XRE family transcriptional regulator
MRRGIADWTAAALAIAVMAFGGLIVVKPAIDHWDDVYRSDPFVVGTTTQKLRTREPAAGKSQAARVSRTTTTTTEDASSFAERLLGKSGTLLLRLGLVGLVAYLAGAVLQRALLGNYSLRRAQAPAAPRPVPALNGNGKVRPAKPEPAEAPTATLGNGAEAPPEAPANLAPGIAKLVSSRREALGLSQRELAKRAGISHTVVSRIEGGDHSPSPKTLERLADVLG